MTSGAAPANLIIVTGMSGAGKTLVLHHLEDLGYEGVDNLPLGLIDAAANQVSVDTPMAVGIDVRTRDFSAPAVLDMIRNSAAKTSLVFVDCDDDVLVQRYTETRRRHPLADELPLGDAMALERSRLADLKEAADTYVDTTVFAPQDLKTFLNGHFARSTKPRMRIAVMSFSYRRGIPREADLVFDARFLRNPHYETALKPLTGQDAEVVAFIEDDPDYHGFLRGIQSLVGPLLPRYRDEGKSYLTLAVGCTGGRHRSVAVAQALGAWLTENGHEIDLRHRELTLKDMRSGPGHP